MKKAFLLLVFCFPLSINPAFSQTKQESIRELFKYMNQDSMTEKMMNSMMPVMMDQMKSQFPPLGSSIDTTFQEMMKSITESTRSITKQMMDREMIDLYDKYFSQAEINDFITFYKSPSGQKFIKVTPDLTKDLMVVMFQKYIPEIQNSIISKIEEVFKSYKK